MSTSSMQASMRKRLLAIGLAVALIAAAVMSYPVWNTSASDSNAHQLIEDAPVAGPIFGPGGGGGGG